MKAARNFRLGGSATPSLPAAEARACALGAGPRLGELYPPPGWGGLRGFLRLALSEIAPRATRKPMPTPRLPLAPSRGSCHGADGGSLLQTAETLLAAAEAAADLTALPARSQRAAGPIPDPWP